MLNRREALTRAGLGLAMLPMIGGVPGRAQQKSEINISRQPGILYMPLHVMEKFKLVEKHAEKLGLSGTAVKWLYFSNGGAQQDALLSGGVDIINTGAGQLLLLWDRTKGGVKGIVSCSAAPLTVISRESRIKTLNDITANDRIAVPTVKISTQAVLLQMDAAQMFGADQWERFDPQTVQMGHPDAYIAMKNPNHEVRNHFAAPPYDYYELKNVPEAHVLTNSVAIIGGNLSQAQAFCTTKFADANPKLILAYRDAAQEAKQIIETRPREALEAYRELNNDKTPIELLLDILSQPGMSQWDLYPQGTMKFAAHLKRTGAMKTLPSSWKEYYLPLVHDLPGS